jgi:hypothetical protein
MNNLYINIDPELVYYPVVDFNYETGICEIKGESYMEETYKFYEPIINWLQDYVFDQKPIVLNIKLTYFNTSTSRFLLKMMDILRRYREAGGKVEINWYYKKEDPDIISEINDFKEDSGVDINILVMD